MKLKEKLGYEFSLGRTEHDDDTAFVAGFEKARELAVAEFDASLKRYMNMEFHKAWVSVARDIGNVGEEEEVE